jgi:hypothetical protein
MAITFVNVGITTGNTGTVTIPVPAAVAANDVLIARVAFRGGSGVTINTPAGWTLVRRDDDGANQSSAIFSRVATGGEPANYAWTLGSAQNYIGSMLAYRGVDIAAIVGQQTGNTTASSTTQTSPSVTPTRGGSFILRYLTMARGDAAPFTAPGSHNERTDQTVGNNPGGIGATVADAQQFAPAATGTANFTSSGAAVGIVQTLALNVNLVTANVDVVGTGTTSPAARVDNRAVASVTGTGTVSATAQVNNRAVASVTGTATVLTTANVDNRASASLTGVGSVSGISRVINEDASSSSGTATVLATAQVNNRALATVTATGSVLANDKVRWGGGASLIGPALAHPA